MERLCFPWQLDFRRRAIAERNVWQVAERAKGSKILGGISSPPKFLGQI